MRFRLIVSGLIGENAGNCRVHQGGSRQGCSGVRYLLVQMAPSDITGCKYLLSWVLRVCCLWAELSSIFGCFHAPLVDGTFYVVCIL